LFALHAALVKLMMICLVDVALWRRRQYLSTSPRTRDDALPGQDSATIRRVTAQSKESGQLPERAAKAR